MPTHMNHAMKRRREEVKSKRNGEGPSKKKMNVRSESGNGHNADTDFFHWLLGISEKEFFKNYFEKKHLVCSHGNAQYFKKTANHSIPPVQWSTEEMLDIIDKHPMQYGTDLNVVRFDEKEKKRVSFKTSGLATRTEVEHCMKNGWSVRVLRPHEFIESNSAFISTMEGLFGCYCGVNSYWTPAKSQGFAPHYDDVDVFLLQLEGEKEWRLYDPPEDVDYLSRHSSEDYTPDMFPTPKETITLRAGDVLYMPRGVVHQGRTPSSTHSLHITFSSNQMNSWADLMLRAAQQSVETLSANSVEWRKALPRTLTRTLGAIWNPEFRAGAGLAAVSVDQAADREAFQTKFRDFVAELTMLLADEANMDVCTDMYAKDTVQKLQPFSRTYKPAIAGEAEEMDTETKVRLASRNCCRLLLNVPDEAQLFHNGENAPVCLQGSLGMFRFEADYAPALATLIAQYPKYTAVNRLPFPGFDDPEDVEDNQMTLAEVLREAGILEVEHRGN